MHFNSSTMSETTYPNSPAQRPTFLTVLCILSFLAGAWGLWNGYQGSFTDKPQRDLEEARIQMEEAMDQMGDGANEMVTNMMESGLALAETSAAKAVPLGYITLLTSALSLLGVWMMWNLRRNGYWIYVLASVAGLVLPFFFLGFSMLALVGLGFGAFVTVLFIVLYGLNLKHMQ